MGQTFQLVGITALTVISAITAVTTLQGKVPGDLLGEAFAFTAKGSKEKGADV